MNKSLQNITRADLANAGKKETNAFSICPAGTHVAKVIGFTEEEHYNYVSLEINKVRYNFFYNYYLRDGITFDEDVLNWIISLSTIPVKDDTSLLEITNSAIGSSYKVEVYNYTPKTGKNAGKPQHGIQFSKVPELVVVDVVTEEYELPY